MSCPTSPIQTRSSPSSRSVLSPERADCGITSDCYFYGEKEVKGGLAGRTEASQALERDRSERSERWGLH